MVVQLNTNYSDIGIKLAKTKDEFGNATVDDNTHITQNENSNNSDCKDDNNTNDHQFGSLFVSNTQFGPPAPSSFGSFGFATTREVFDREDFIHTIKQYSDVYIDHIRSRSKLGSNKNNQFSMSLSFICGNMKTNQQPIDAQQY